MAIKKKVMKYSKYEEVGKKKMIEENVKKYVAD